jgi:hypothetical protein
MRSQRRHNGRLELRLSSLRNWSGTALRSLHKPRWSALDSQLCLLPILPTRRAGDLGRLRHRPNAVHATGRSLLVDRSDPSEVARVAKKSMRKGLRTLDTNGQLVAPNDIFDAVTADGTNTIILMPQRELDVDDQTLDPTGGTAISILDLLFSSSHTDG